MVRGGFSHPYFKERYIMDIETIITELSNVGLTLLIVLGIMFIYNYFKRGK
tara:strand:- start:15 stop:167 length:153 start_codon:yes stop_codon:yes gene_type:complete